MKENRIKRAVLFSLFFLINFSIYAQVQIQQLSPVSVSYSQRDIYNLSVINNTNKSFKGAFYSQVYAENGELLLETYSKIVDIKTGYNQFNSYAVYEPNQVVYHSKNLQEFELMYKSFPAGSYRVCISIKCYSSDCFEAIQDNVVRVCNNQVVQPRVNLLLTSPKNGAVIENPFPQLTWIPIVLLGDNSIYYSIKLVEVNKGKKVQQAIQENSSLLFLDNLTSNIVQYPTNLPALTPGSRYAWQVVAYNKFKKIIAKSDVWEFSVLLKTDLTVANTYIKLLEGNAGGIVEIPKRTLFIRFDERYISSQFNCSIYNSQGTAVNFQIADTQSDTSVIDDSSFQEGSATISANHGLNRYAINLENYNLSPGIYTLVATNAKSEKFYLRFKIK